MFEEVENVATQQNIVGSLLMQIGIGSDDNKKKAANVLASLDEKKLRTHLTLISGILPSYDSIPLSVFKVIMSVIVKLEFADRPEQSSQLHIFVSKMLASTKETAKNAGVITAAAILNRYAQFGDFEAIQTQFNSTMLVIADDPIARNKFYEELCNNDERGEVFNKFLVEDLTKQFSYIISPLTQSTPPNNNSNENECNENNNENDNDNENGGGGGQPAVCDCYSLDDNLDSSIDFISGISESVQKNKTLSLQKYRKSISSVNSPIVFSHSGLKLLLDSHVALGHDLEDSFGKYFRMPLKMFNNSSNDFTNTQRIQCLLSAHSYILETLNYFGPLKTDECISRMLNRYDIEQLLILYLSDFKVFNHPFFGEMFPKCNTQIKKANRTSDPSAYFVSYYRTFFNAPRLEYLDLLYKVDLPIDDESLHICVRLLDDYLYLIKPTRSQSTADQLFECKKVIKPPLSIITFISNTLLDSVLQEDEKQLNVFDMIINRIFVILNTQIMLPVYRDKKEFAMFITAICGKRTQQEAFHHFYSKVNESMKIETIANIVELLKNLIHCGTSSRSVVDLYGSEKKNLCKLSQNLLTQNKLEKNYVKQILPIFFDHNPNILDDVEYLINNAMNIGIFKDNESPDWPSLTKETFDIFFTQCFKLLTSKMAEFKKNLKNNKIEVLDENTIDMMLDRMIKLASLMKNLLMTISSPEIPMSSHQKVIQFGPNWMDNCTELLDFLNDAKQVYPEKVKDYISIIRTIRRNLQAVVTHARRNEPKLLRFLPRISKSLEVWTYKLKMVLPEIFGTDEVKLDHMRERTIDGDYVNSQNH